MPDATESSSPISIESFGIAVGRRITRQIEDRVARLAIVLEQKIQAEYRKQFTVNDADGAADSVTHEIRRSSAGLELVFGSSKSNSYLQYIEFGVKPFAGAQYPAHSKPPPVKSIYDWIRRAKLLIPQYYVERAEAHGKSKKLDTSKPWYSADPIELWAFDITQRIKKRGRAALHVIERVLTQELATIQETFTS